MPARKTLADCHKLAKSRGGKCLATEYTHSTTKMTWECKFKHRWETCYNYIQRGMWCPTCGYNKRTFSVEMCQKHAETKGGKCLSTEYKRIDSKLRWECKEGHQWEATYGGMRQYNYWCPTCAIDRRKLSIDICKKAAKKRGGECLSTKYKNALSNYTWKCSLGHIWNATLNNVKNHGRWCPLCAHNAPITLEDCCRTAEEHGGMCMSDEYISVKTPMLWMCDEGHTWESNANNVRNGNWCPYCSSSRSEETCREIFERLLGFEMKKDRPNFLGNIELDGYNQECKIAFEYQGVQHYEYVDHFHRNYDNYVKRLEYDERKYTLCEQQGVKLILIPYIMNFRTPEKMERYIKDQLLTHGFRCVQKPNKDLTV